MPLNQYRICPSDRFTVEADSGTGFSSIARFAVVEDAREFLSLKKGVYTHVTDQWLADGRFVRRFKQFKRRRPAAAQGVISQL